jgi:hypothetical protein
LTLADILLRLSIPSTQEVQYETQSQNLDKVIRQQVEEFFGQSLVLESIIHRYVGVAEATAMKKGVVENTAATSATFDFTKLFNELKEEMDHEQERHAAVESINR